MVSILVKILQLLATLSVKCCFRKIVLPPFDSRPTVHLTYFQGVEIVYLPKHKFYIKMSGEMSGFSKLTKQQKVDSIAQKYFSEPHLAVKVLQKYWNSDEAVQKLHDDFVENTLTNFYLPLGVAPNFVIDGKHYAVPMVTEESSVVAAAAKSAKFWAERGGFKTTVFDTQKIGQVHFKYSGDGNKLKSFFLKLEPILRSDTDELTKNMKSRGGGILKIELRDKTDLLPNYYQIHATFDTKDSMGANFINSCLEQFAATLKREITAENTFSESEKNIEVVMSILSNYIPNCIVRAEVSCHVDELVEKNIPDGRAFAEKMVDAVNIAKVETYRAVTHNKGIMNGIDAVVIATGNDFRAVEAGVHAYAARNGHYSSLSSAEIDGDILKFSLEIPLALGTVGGITALHPMAKIALEMLGKPNSRTLMSIVAATGLAQNFAALRSLTTTGIQKGHMRMHLNNILTQLEVTDDERKKAQVHFADHTVSHAAVATFLNSQRLSH